MLLKSSDIVTTFQINLFIIDKHSTGIDKNDKKWCVQIHPMLNKES